jgi:hypothetical protein
MSISPPRTANSPASVTVATWAKPMRTRYARSPASSIRPPTVAVKLDSRSTARGGTRCVAALTVVRITAGRSNPAASAASVAMRCAEISELGEIRS